MTYRSSTLPLTRLNSGVREPASIANAATTGTKQTAAMVPPASGRFHDVTWYTAPNAQSHTTSTPLRSTKKSQSASLETRVTAYASNATAPSLNANVAQVRMNPAREK